MSRVKDRQDERRDSKRAFFTLEENIPARVAFLNETGERPQPIPVTLLSISIGGLSFLAARHQFQGLKIGDPLKITGILTPPPLGILDDLQVEIRYIIDSQCGARAAIGVEFIEILQLYRKRIFEYVNHRLAALGLNK